MSTWPPPPDLLGGEATDISELEAKPGLSTSGCLRAECLRPLEERVWVALAVIDPEDLVNWHHPQNLAWLDYPFLSSLPR